MKMPLRSAFFTAATIAVFSPSSVADSAAIVDELKTCARIVESDARVSCYETLGRRLIEDETSTLASSKPVPQVSPTAVSKASPTPVPNAGPTPVPKASPAPVPKASTASAAPVIAGAVSETTPAAVTPSEQPSMNDSMGGYQYAEKLSDNPDNNIHTRVTRCQQDGSKAWYFKFENGQVWKQVDRTTRRFKECDFPVVVSKDGFGYKMQVEGKGAKIRISRRK